MNDQPHAGLCSRDLSALGVVLNHSAVASVDRLAKVQTVEGLLRCNYTTMAAISSITLRMERLERKELSHIYEPTQSGHHLRVYIIYGFLSCMEHTSFEHFNLNDLDKELIKDFFMHRGIHVEDSGAEFDMAFFWN